jgi:hypothetical protein
MGARLEGMTMTVWRTQLYIGCLRLSEGQQQAFLRMVSRGYARLCAQRAMTTTLHKWTLTDLADVIYASADDATDEEATAVEQFLVINGMA